MYLGFRPRTVYCSSHFFFSNFLRILCVLFCVCVSLRALRVHGCSRLHLKSSSCARTLAIRDKCTPFAFNGCRKCAFGPHTHVFLEMACVSIPNSPDSIEREKSTRTRTPRAIPPTRARVSSLAAENGDVSRFQFGSMLFALFHFDLRSMRILYTCMTSSSHMPVQCALPFDRNDRRSDFQPNNTHICVCWRSLK